MTQKNAIEKTPFLIKRANNENLDFNFRLNNKNFISKKKNSIEMLSNIGKVFLFEMKFFCSIHSAK